MGWRGLTNRRHVPDDHSMAHVRMKAELPPPPADESNWSARMNWCGMLAKAASIGGMDVC